MTRTIILSIAVALMFWNTVPAGAKEFGTAPEAQAMLYKAIDALQAKRSERVGRFFPARQQLRRPGYLRFVFQHERWKNPITCTPGGESYFGYRARYLTIAPPG